MFMNNHAGEAVPEPRNTETLEYELGALALPSGENWQRHGGGHHGVGAAAVSTALAVVVRLAQRLPLGSREREALAEASLPLREALG